MAQTGDDDTIARRYDAQLARRLLRYVGPYRTLVVGALVLIAIESALQLVGPLLSRRIIDVAFPTGDLTMAVQLAVVFAMAMVAQFAASFGETMLTNLLGQRIMRDLRNELFARLQRLPITFFDRTPVGRLVTRVTSDVEALNELFTSGVVAGIGDLFTLVGISIAMLIIDWRLALAAFVVIPFVFLASRVFQTRVRSAYREIRTRLARLNAFINERLSGVRIVQLFGRESTEQARFHALNDSHLDAHLRSINIYALYFPIIEFLTTLALASLLVVGGARVDAGIITVGTVAAFLQLVRRFFQPLQDLSEKFNVLQAAMAAAERIFGLLDEVEAPGLAPTENREAQTDALRHEGVTVEFDDVWFTYESNPREGDVRWVLRGISFVVKPGETAALVGHTGAGKSTIVNLLLRFYEPQRGQIRVNGVDIRDIPVDVLRSLVGYVQQDIFLFAGDVASNLRLGTDRTDEALQHAAALVGANRVIDRLPGGWQFHLAERGGSISVGERQLLAFARAVAADPALLILDEATSAVDSELEAALQRAVAALMNGRTTIAIAHRLSTVLGATIILVLHHGEIVERGTHRALLGHGGLYERLFRLQIGDLRDDTPSLRSTEPDSAANEEPSAAVRLPSHVTSG